MDQKKIKIFLIILTVILIGTISGVVYKFNREKTVPKPVPIQSAQTKTTSEEILKNLPPASAEHASEIEKKSEELLNKLPPLVTNNQAREDASSAITSQELLNSLPSPK